jgi:moderate conductance mechanosensitive channel
MNHDVEWKEKILEEPTVLGVETFSDRAIMVRVFIKTEPLKQWEIAREFRRRIKITFDQESIPLPLPQQEIKIIN